MLKNTDEIVVKMALKAISCIWNPGNRKCDKPLVDFEVNDLAECLESMSIHQNFEIAKLAKDISGYATQETDGNKQQE